jgi:hypothetical protein
MLLESGGWIFLAQRNHAVPIKGKGKGSAEGTSARAAAPCSGHCSVRCMGQSHAKTMSWMSYTLIGMACLLACLLACLPACLLAATMQPFFSAWSTACTGAAAVFLCVCS